MSPLIILSHISYVVFVHTLYVGATNCNRIPLEKRNLLRPSPSDWRVRHYEPISEIGPTMPGSSFRGLLTRRGTRKNATGSSKNGLRTENARSTKFWFASSHVWCGSEVRFTGVLGRIGRSLRLASAIRIAKFSIEYPSPVPCQLPHSPANAPYLDPSLSCTGRWAAIPGRPRCPD